MKTAFAYWDNRIVPVFDTAHKIHVVETESEKVVCETQETLSKDQPVHKALRLVELDIGVLVCGAISRPMYGLIDGYGIQVIPFVAGDLREVIQAWLSGNLERDAFTMPGCRGRRIFNKNNQKEVNNMPRRDGTGPEGHGPNTGKGRGRCKSGKNGRDCRRGTNFGTGQRKGKGGGQGSGSQIEEK